MRAFRKVQGLLCYDLLPGNARPVPGPYVPTRMVPAAAAPMDGGATIGALTMHVVYRQLQRVSGFVRFPLCSLVTNELDFSIISLGENFGQVWISVSVTRRQLHAVARDDDSHDRALRLGASSRRRSTGLSQAHVRASRPCRERMRCVPSHTSSFRCFCHLCRR